VTEVVEYGALPRLVRCKHAILAPSIGPITHTLDPVILLPQ
jgi:hypothetical protein